MFQLFVIGFVVVFVWALNRSRRRILTAVYSLAPVIVIAFVLDRIASEPYRYWTLVFLGIDVMFAVGAAVAYFHSSHTMKCIPSGLSVKNPVPLRILLPSCFLLLSIALTNISERHRMAIIDDIVSRWGSLHEPMPDAVAWERFVDFAINGPAWGAAWSIPRTQTLDVESHLTPHVRSLFYGRIMRYDVHWWYYIFLIGMWFVVGTVIDRIPKRNVAAGEHAHPKLVWLWPPMLISYGIFVAYTGWSYREWEYGDRFIFCIYAWGVVLVLFGLSIGVRSILQLRRSLRFAT